jgi:hypothetical protein
MIIYKCSYKMGDVNVMLVVSFFMEIPFTTLRETLKQRGLRYHIQRTDLHVRSQ